MSLDERVRDGLRASAQRGGLDADDVLADVQAAFRRGERRRRLASQAVVVVVVLALFAGVASLVSLRTNHNSSSTASARYQSTATIRVASAVRSTPPSPIVLGSATALALAPATRAAALAAAHVAINADVEFHGSLDRAGDILSLTTIAPTASESETLTRSWAVAFGNARRAEARNQLRRQTVALKHRITQLRNELLHIDAELLSIDPTTWNGIQLYDAPSTGPGPISYPLGISPKAPRRMPANASVHELNLANARTQTLGQLGTDDQESAGLRIVGVTPEIFATIISGTPATRVVTRHTSTGHWTASDISIVTVVILLAGAAAVVVFRRRRRSGQVAA